MEPNILFSWSGNFLTYGTKYLSLKVHSYAADQKTSFSYGTQHLVQLIRKLPSIVKPNKFFSWSENFLILWNPATFSADQKTFLSYGTRHFYLKVHSYAADQKTSFFCGTQHLVQLIRKLLTLRNQTPLFKSSQLRGWSYCLLLLWCPAPFSADQKTSFSCGAQHLFQLIRKLPSLVEPSTFSADQKTSFSYETQQLFQLIKKLS